MNAKPLAALLLSSCLGLASCSTGSAIRTGRVLAPTQPEQVQVLTKHPAQYETLGLVEASTEEGLFEKGSEAGQRALKELKVQASTLGANAVVLKSYTSESRPDTLFQADDDLGFLSDAEHKKITGEAILKP